MDTIKVISDYTPDVEVPRVIQTIAWGIVITAIDHSNSIGYLPNSENVL
jgi:hypothetical protein